ncbi:sensor histidine kinase [Piscibacillus sp. B03]
MEKHLLWLWIGMLLVVWGVSLGELSQVNAYQYLGSASFFAIIFLLPALKNHKHLTVIGIMTASVITTLVFWQEVSALHILTFTYLLGETVYRLKGRAVYIAGSLIAVNIILLSPISVTFSIIYAVFALVVSFISYQKLTQLNDADSRYQALLHEYRKIKLKSATDEKFARQEERTQIGREIHDRVGHKLTNLLMQLEVTRMESVGDTKTKINELKMLAKDSLEETRSAVKAMDHEDVGGLTAIVRLIRKLEAENYIRIHFSAKHKAFSSNLTAEQAIVVYRSIQEALTNVMKHSAQREVSILFESPGESVFKFEVSNPVNEQDNFQEGFGLKSMRERLSSVGGELDVRIYQNRFLLRGTVPLKKKGSGVKWPE